MSEGAESSGHEAMQDGDFLKIITAYKPEDSELIPWFRMGGESLLTK